MKDFSYVEDFVTQVKTQAPGFVSISIVKVQDSSVLISESINDRMSAESSAIFHAEIYRQSLRSLVDFDSQSGDKSVSEILIMADQHIYIIASSPQGKFLAILAVDANKTNLGLSRAVLEKTKVIVGGRIDKDFG